MSKEKVQNTKEYSLQEVAKLQLIPGVGTYSTAYNLVTHFVNEGKEKVRVLNEKTTRTGIKAINNGKPWKKIAGKITVKGSEILKFLRLNGLK